MKIFGDLREALGSLLEASWKPLGSLLGALGGSLGVSWTILGVFWDAGKAQRALS